LNFLYINSIINAITHAADLGGSLLTAGSAADLAGQLEVDCRDCWQVSLMSPADCRHMFCIDVDVYLLVMGVLVSGAVNHIVMETPTIMP